MILMEKPSVLNIFYTYSHTTNTRGNSTSRHNVCNTRRVILFYEKYKFYRKHFGTNFGSSFLGASFGNSFDDKFLATGLATGG